MSKSSKIKRGLPYIIIAGVTAVLLLITLILHLVQIRPMEQFMTADRVFAVASVDGSSRFIDGQDEVFDQAFESVRHSVLRNMFENSGNHRVRPHTVYNDLTSEWDRVSHSAAALEFIRPGVNEFMFRLEWDNTQFDNDLFYYYRECLEHEGEYIRHNIAFDRMLVIIPAPTGEIQRVRLIPFMSANLNNGIGGYFGEGVSWPNAEGVMSSRLYRVHEFSSYMYVRRMHQILQDADGFSPGGGGIVGDDDGGADDMPGGDWQGPDLGF